MPVVSVLSSDRKKDLVKLQSGEYISLGRVETVLKTSPLVENMFVYAESSKTHVVAVVLPQLVPLRQLARGVSASLSGASLAELCASEQLERQVQKVLAEHGRAGQSRGQGSQQDTAQRLDL